MCSSAPILMDELIGLEIEIVKSMHREWIGKRGKVVDETMRTFTIETAEGEIKVPKKDCVFRFHRGEKTEDVDGKELEFRPEERIKKHWRKFRK